MDFCTVGCHTIFISFLGTSIFCCILKLSNSFMHFSPQQPSPSHFFSRAGELNIFLRCCPQQVTSWAYILTLYLTLKIWDLLMRKAHVDFVHQTFAFGLEMWWADISGGGICGTNRGGGCILPEYKSLFELHVTSNKMWSRLWFDREKWNEFCFLLYWLFLPQKQIRSQWQVW